MNWVSQAISDFGRSIGIPLLELDEYDQLRLALDEDCQLLIHYMPDIALPEVVVSRTEPLRFSPPLTLRQALRCADYRLPNPWPLQVGATERDLMIAMRIPERAFVINVLEQALTHLEGMHQKIRGGL